MSCATSFKEITMLHKNTMYRLVEFAVGLLFGIGLMFSGMTDPGKVIGFLDLFGSWDPSLALVMGGAIMVGFFAFAVAKKRTTTFLGGVMRFPTNTDIDKKLVIGSLMSARAGVWRGFAPVLHWFPWPMDKPRRWYSC
jgi:hypothetical protein